MISNNCLSRYSTLALSLFISILLIFNSVTLAQRIDMGEIENDEIHEASGIAASGNNPGVLWVHNDSGDENRIFAINYQGKDLGTYYIENADNRDWEDIAIGPGPDESQQYIYIAEIGDNRSRYNTKMIYRLKEPHVKAEQSPVDTSLNNVEVIKFTFPDGRRDAEAILVDPVTRDIYIFSKREPSVSVYMAPYPQPVDSTYVLKKLGKIPFTQITAGDLSPDSKALLLKNYNSVYLWYRENQESLIQTLFREPIKPVYILEPQGEAITWHPDRSGYFTLSETKDRIPAHLYFYKLTNPEDQNK